MGMPTGGPSSNPLVNITNPPESNLNFNIPNTKSPSYASSVTDPSCQEQGIVMARRTTHNGQPALVFKASKYYGAMTSLCRRTIVGRFLKSRPQIDILISRFCETYPLKRTVNIGVFDNFNIFLTFNKDADLNFILYKRVIDLEGYQIWLQKWTPDFKLEEDTPIVPVWVLLPGLPFHMHNWNYVKQIASVVGTPIEIDVAAKNMNRPSMAKVRVEINLLKPLIHSIWVETEDENSPLRGYSQKIEYENIPKYCKHCKKLGHSMIDYRALIKKKEMEKKEAQQKAQLDKEHEHIDATEQPK
ncbi:uncharacterized protein LOC132601267 [Lycium barbarum]|uniref:uncharacterized protein LOC132601267 n=1 Tax=Lycium barbarum TaxID=112863 RepID=UPI00293E5B07|nr:uncharacterized protein LOC132601267 [Lycium barbarum]